MARNWFGLEDPDRKGRPEGYPTVVPFRPKQNVWKVGLILLCILAAAIIVVCLSGR